jgi:hypothetical protein
VMAVLGDGYFEVFKHVWLAAYLLLVTGLCLLGALGAGVARLVRSRRTVAAEDSSAPANRVCRVRGETANRRQTAATLRSRSPRWRSTWAPTAAWVTRWRSAGSAEPAPSTASAPATTAASLSSRHGQSSASR